MSDLEKNNSIAELVKGERAFLHEISNHIVVAQGMSSFVLRSLKEASSEETKEIERLEKALHAITQMSALLKERRELLHSLS